MGEGVNESKTGTHLWGVQVDQLDDAWTMVRGLVIAAIERGGTDTEESILACLRSGEMQLWVIWDAHSVKGICMTKIMRMPLKTVLRIPICTGEDAADWVGHLGTIEQWAKSVGCDTVEPLARPGWEKYLRSMGYQKTHVLLEKSL